MGKELKLQGVSYPSMKEFLDTAIWESSEKAGATTSFRHCLESPDLIIPIKEKVNTFSIDPDQHNPTRIPLLLSMYMAIIIIIIIIIIIVTMAIMVIMVMVMVMVMVRISIDPSALVDLVGHGALEWADRHVILVGTADVILLVGVKIIVVVVVDVIMPEPVGQRSQQVVGFLREAAIIGAQYKGGRKRLTLGRHHQNQRSTQTQTYTCQIKELIFWVPLLLLALSGYGC